MTDVLKQKALAFLRQSLADPNAQFRPGQYEAIEMLVQSRSRLLVVQRTGWGKSSVYFLATRLLRDQGTGPALLISPLQALMRDQIIAANRLGVRAAAYNTDNQPEWPEVKRRLHANQIDVLLITPEKLANEDFRRNVLLPVASRIGLFIVDEAHCISDWGHDFRPDYLRITRILQALPTNIPLLATTATANDRVVADVVGQLGPQLQVVRGPLVRESLQLQNITMPSQASRLAWLAEQVPKFVGSGIIYTLTVRDADRVAFWLKSQGIDVHPYHSKFAAEVRADLEQRLLDNKIKSLVATSGLGMGFDKPDLGFVIHYQRPGSAVHYYQQVGRAGRAIPQAYGILFSGKEDSRITDHFLKTAFPSEAHVDEVLAALRQADDGLSISLLQRQINLGKSQIEKTLKSLEAHSPAPVVKQGTLWKATPVPYTPNHDKIMRLTQIRLDERERMQEYAQSQTCLMQFLARELNDPNPMPCGRCAVCQGRLLLPDNASAALIKEANQFLRRSDQSIELRRSDQSIEPRKEWADKKRIPLNLRAQTGRALCLWGDDGWGELVRRGKQEDEYFDDHLVTALVEMIQERWKPQPAPTWVTYIPSLNHLELVPNFARRIAAKLGLSLVPCVRKVRQTMPQKQMQNSVQQSNNIQGAFAIGPEKTPTGAVLLLDDMVDSGWTLAVVASQLLQAGSGPVFPVTLAVTTKNED